MKDSECVSAGAGSDSKNDGVCNGEKVGVSVTNGDAGDGANTSGLGLEELDIRFNPDVFTPSVKHVDPDGTECAKQKEQIVSLGRFLLTHQIPAFLSELTHLRYDPTLSEGIIVRLRNNFGINIRYLGLIADKLRTVPELSYPFTVVIGTYGC